MLDRQNIRLIIFDVDGVLITGGNEGYFRCFHHALTGVGLNVDPSIQQDFQLQNWGVPGPDQLKMFLHSKPELVEKAARLYWEYMQSTLFLEYLKPIDGFPDVIRQLNKMYFKQAIASGMEGTILRRLMSDHFVLAFFDWIMSGYEIPDPAMQKPSPYMIQKIMYELSFLPEQTVYVGDAETDFIAAKNANVHFIAVLSGHLSFDQTRKHKIKFVISSIKDLPKLFSCMK